MKQKTPTLPRSATNKQKQTQKITTFPCKNSSVLDLFRGVGDGCWYWNLNDFMMIWDSCESLVSLNLWLWKLAEGFEDCWFSVDELVLWKLLCHCIFCAGSKSFLYAIFRSLFMSYAAALIMLDWESWSRQVSMGRAWVFCEMEAWGTITFGRHRRGYQFWTKERKKDSSWA